MANMVGQVLESHKITFHEDELPPEGISHNKALHITVQCEDHFITRILVDGGSSLNICPLITLRTLGKGLHEVKDRAISVKDFDGSQRSTIGEISLCLQMGPTWFDVEFQVIDVPPADTLYGSEEDEALAAIKNLFLEDDMDCCVIFEEEGEEGPSIQAVNRGERLTNCITITYLDDEPTTVTCNEAMQQTDIDSEEDDILKEETRISAHFSPSEKKEYTEFLKEYEDIFAWSYDDMNGLSTSIVAHKLPTDPTWPPIWMDEEDAEKTAIITP
ncbi:uncharacterized protein [Nicotiana sylvestris]|uniref:uncharacterized protein n=1 Tax=Nicotiana sylvestris TaxID=4096 RepID=UPI00388CCE22